MGLRQGVCRDQECVPLFPMMPGRGHDSGRAFYLGYQKLELKRGTAPEGQILPRLGNTLSTPSE